MIVLLTGLILENTGLVISTVEKRSRSLALKTKDADIESCEESSNECSDTENLNILTRRFHKFIKMKGKMKNQQSKRYNKKPDSNSTKFTCFGCGKQGRSYESRLPKPC